MGSATPTTSWDRMNLLKKVNLAHRLPPAELCTRNSNNCHDKHYDGRFFHKDTPQPTPLNSAALT
jgi:hypothetical protein